MTLYEACEIAESCGLKTIGEAIMNVELHYDVFFSIADLVKEEKAFYEDIAKYNVTQDTLITDILKLNKGEANE